jgi:hypothetical protein
MNVKTIQEVAKMGGEATSKKHKGKHALWGRKGGLNKAKNRAKKLLTP